MQEKKIKQNHMAFNFDPLKAVPISNEREKRLKK